MRRVSPSQSSFTDRTCWWCPDVAPFTQYSRRLLARGPRTGRVDDTAEVVAHRLDVFDTATTPLLEYYNRRETLLCVDGSQAVEEVTRAAIALIDRAAEEL